MDSLAYAHTPFHHHGALNKTVGGGNGGRARGRGLGRPAACYLFLPFPASSAGSSLLVCLAYSIKDMHKKCSTHTYTCSCTRKGRVQGPHHVCQRHGRGPPLPRPFPHASPPPPTHPPQCRVKERMNIQTPGTHASGPPHTYSNSLLTGVVFHLLKEGQTVLCRGMSAKRDGHLPAPHHHRTCPQSTL